MAIYSPPHANGANVIKIFPEIFEKHELIRFQLPGGRMSDFWASSIYFYSAKEDQDLYKVFSSVQRLYGAEHFDPFEYLQQKTNRKKLLGVEDDTLLKETLQQLAEAYNSRYGMRKQIFEFYTEFLDKEGKQLINGRLYRPASYKAKAAIDADSQLKLRLELLLHLRDRAGHGAAFIPLASNNEDQFMQIEMHLNGKSIEWFSKLTFADFYEATRRAMARFWLKEYGEYLENGGKEIIDKVIADVMKQSEELNRRAQEQKTSTHDSTKS